MYMTKDPYVLIESTDPKEKRLFPWSSVGKHITDRLANLKHGQTLKFDLTVLYLDEPMARKCRDALKWIERFRSQLG